MKKQTYAFCLRLPEDLEKTVKASASASDRSINNEICYRLRRVYEAEGEKSHAEQQA